MNKNNNQKAKFVAKFDSQTTNLVLTSEQVKLMNTQRANLMKIIPQIPPMTTNDAVFI